jgi:hypothetical protein
MVELLLSHAKSHSLDVRGQDAKSHQPELLQLIYR